MLLAVLATGCSKDNTPELTGNGDAVELGITAGVELTKSAIQSGTQTGNGVTIMQEVGVLAKNVTDSETDYGTNNSAVYTQSTSWSSTAPIYLTAQKAVIYGYYPVYANDANGNKNSTPITVTNPTTPLTATIPIAVFVGGDTETGTAPYLKANSTITDADNSSDGSILSAPGELDYMWESTSSRTNVSNRVGDAQSVALNMSHALSMVSFKIYKDASYKGTGKLSKIILKNVDAGGTDLSTGGSSMAMKIADGTISGQSATGATYTRLIVSSAGAADGADLATSSSAAHSYSIVVLPGTADRNKIQVVLTIDGVDYTVKLADATSSTEWAVGANNTYAVKLSGTALSITSVTVAAWTSNSAGNLDAK